MDQVNEEKNLGDAVVDQDQETEQVFNSEVSEQIERDTARGLWNKPSADEDDDDC